MRDEEVPEVWDWRDVDGVNRLSWTVNQHIPQYCGSCWAQSAASALADRFILTGLPEYQNLALSVQAILNCRMGGDCDGGNMISVFNYGHDYGVSNATPEIFKRSLVTSLSL